MSDKREIRLPPPPGRLTEAYAEGGIPPSLLLELLYYASEPDLLAAMRAVAALDPPDRLKVLSLARGLARPIPGAAWAGRKIDA